MLLADRDYDVDWIRERLQEGSVGQHPAEKQPRHANLLQAVSLPCPQSRRMVLQQDKTVPWGTIHVLAEVDYCTLAGDCRVETALHAMQILLATLRCSIYMGVKSDSQKFLFTTLISNP
jgi:hypothetical protein